MKKTSSSALDVPVPEPLDIAVRAFAVAGRKSPDTTGWQRLPHSGFALVFDTETSTDEAQSLRFGTYLVLETDEIQEHGVFYDPDALAPDELRLLRAWAKRHGYKVRTRNGFINRVFFPVVDDAAGLCVGFNLPFDFPRVALRSLSSKRRMRGGFTHVLTENPVRPRVRVKRINRRASLIDLASGHGRSAEHRNWNKGGSVARHRGHFVDVRTIASAMTGESHSLETLSRLLGVAHTKHASGGHGKTLTEDYLDYAMTDVLATWECFVTLRDRYFDFNLSRTPITAIYSSASVAKGYFKEMGIRTWAERASDLPPGVTSALMEAYYGGRCETKIRKQVTQVFCCDFLSAYPTGFSLIGLWDFVICESVKVEDATEATQRLLDHVTPESLRDPDLWGDLTTLVEIEPDCDILPVRCKFTKRGASSVSTSYVSSAHRHVYTIAHCLGSTLLTGHAPKVHRAWRFRPQGIQTGLSQVRLPGSDGLFDPRAGSFVRALTERRCRLKIRRDAARNAGDFALAARLDADQLASKIIANSAAYGIGLELNVERFVKGRVVTAFDVDGNSYDQHVRLVEKPGHYFNPLVATFVAASAHLMLALAECLATREGLSWVFCDTDSMALAKPEGMNEEEFVERALRVSSWFDPLNPYEGGGPLFEPESVNYRIGHPKEERRIEPLYCFAISSKRYALFNIDEDGRPILRRASAHRLGHLVPPYRDGQSPPDIPDPSVPLQEVGTKRWQYDLWFRIIEAALAGIELKVSDLPGFDAPALSRFAVSSPAQLSWFKGANSSKPLRERVAPQSFMVCAQLDPFGLPLGEDAKHFTLVAPYVADASKWRELEFVEIHTGMHYPVTVGEIIEGAVTLKAYADIAWEYVAHPETKMADSEGRSGLQQGNEMLHRRHVEVQSIEYIGKESNLLDEANAGLVRDPVQVRNRYEPRNDDLFLTHYVPAMRFIAPRQIREAAGVSASTTNRLIAGSAPRHETKQRVMQAVDAIVRDALMGPPSSVGPTRLKRLEEFIAVFEHASRMAKSCPTCGAALSATRALYCGPKCRQQAHRRRLAP
ncbi:MAG: DNA polymerase [Coriobacteriia bacterium]|nr:DNA polymerase [Coriobacteriia bacterium]